MIVSNAGFFVLIDLDAENVASDGDTAEECLAAIRTVADAQGWPAVRRLTLMHIQGEEQRLVAMENDLVELVRTLETETTSTSAE